MKRLETQMEVVELSKLRPHPLLEELGIDNDNGIDKLTTIYSGLSIDSGYYGIVVADANNRIVCNLHIWSAMLNNGMTKGRVDIIKNLEEDNIIEFINANSLFTRRTALGKGRLFTALKTFLTTTARGKEMAKGMKGERTNDKISACTGYGASTIKMYLSIYEHDKDLLMHVGNEEGQTTLTQTYTEVQARKHSEQGDDDNKSTDENQIGASSERAQKQATGTHKSSSKAAICYKPDVEIQCTEKKFELTYKQKYPVLFVQKDVIERSNTLLYIFSAEKDEKLQAHLKIIEKKTIKDIA